MQNFDSDPTSTSAALALICAPAAMATMLAVEDSFPREALVCPHLPNPNVLVDVQGSTLTDTTCNVVLLGGSELPLALSSNSSATYLFEDNPNWHSFHDMPFIGNAANEDSVEKSFWIYSIHQRRPKEITI
jgi:hypothetical protein